MAAARRDALLVAHSLAPLLLAVPVVVGITLSLGDILTTRYPDLGWGYAIASDAKALATGTPIYAEPGDRYTGMLYAPLLPALLAPLYRIFWWDGWGVLVAALSSIGLGALVGVVAASGPGRTTAHRIASGVGLGGVAWWLVCTDAQNDLYEARADQLAWLLALAGLCVLALGIAQGWTRVWPAVLLLSAALWTKQTTVGAATAAVLVTSWWAWTDVMPRRTWARFVGGLAAVNGAALAGLVLLTDGWLWYFLFELPSRHYSDPALRSYIAELARLLVVPVTAVVVAGSGAWRGRAGGAARSFAGLLAVLLIVFLVIQVMPSLIGRRKQGGGVNHYIGMIWALGLLLALAHRAAHRSREALVAGVTAYVFLATVALVPPLQRAIAAPQVVDPGASVRADVDSVDPAVVEYARSHLVFDALGGVISTTPTKEVFPTQANVVDLLAAGEAPRYLVDALIERRFDAVRPSKTAGLAAFYVAVSGNGSSSYPAALNALMRIGYAAGANGAPDPLLGRRPGAVDLIWARPCFDMEDPLRCVKAGPTNHPASPP